jgi:hypothetical protein
MKKTELFYTVGGLYSNTAFMENSMEATQQTKNSCTGWFIYTTTGYISKGNEREYQRVTLPSLLPHFSQYPFYGTNLGIYQ